LAGEIAPGKSAEVNGPYLCDMDGGACHIHIGGEITCHEAPDDDKGFLVSKGNQLTLKEDGATPAKGITVRHHSDDQIINVD